jgi:hypothetical protein
MSVANMFDEQSDETPYILPATQQQHNESLHTNGHATSGASNAAHLANIVHNFEGSSTSPSNNNININNNSMNPIAATDSNPANNILKLKIRLKPPSAGDSPEQQHQQVYLVKKSDKHSLLCDTRDIHVHIRYAVDQRTCTFTQRDACVVLQHIPFPPLVHSASCSHLFWNSHNNKDHH